MKKSPNNLGCGQEFDMKSLRGFICGVPDGNGTEHFCKNCMNNLRRQWRKETEEMWEKRNKYLAGFKKGDCPPWGSPLFSLYQFHFS